LDDVPTSLLHRPAIRHGKKLVPPVRHGKKSLPPCRAPKNQSTDNTINKKQPGKGSVQAASRENSSCSDDNNSPESREDNNNNHDSSESSGDESCFAATNDDIVPHGRHLRGKQLRGKQLQAPEECNVSPLGKKSKKPHSFHNEFDDEEEVQEGESKSFGNDWSVVFACLTLILVSKLPCSVFFHEDTSNVCKIIGRAIGRINRGECVIRPQSLPKIKYNSLIYGCACWMSKSCAAYVPNMKHFKKGDTNFRDFANKHLDNPTMKQVQQSLALVCTLLSQMGTVNEVEQMRVLEPGDAYTSSATQLVITMNLSLSHCWCSWGFMIMSPVFIRKSHLTISLATTETISLFITL
jgi:hypothetical protein